MFLFISHQEVHNAGLGHLQAPQANIAKFPHIGDTMTSIHAGTNNGQVMHFQKTSVNIIGLNFCPAKRVHFACFNVVAETEKVSATCSALESGALSMPTDIHVWCL